MNINKPFFFRSLILTCGARQRMAKPLKASSRELPVIAYSPCLIQKSRAIFSHEQVPCITGDLVPPIFSVLAIRLLVVFSVVTLVHVPQHSFETPSVTICCFFVGTLEGS